MRYTTASVQNNIHIHICVAYLVDLREALAADIVQVEAGLYTDKAYRKMVVIYTILYVCIQEK